MTLETTRPETEARLKRYLQSGQFLDLDELLARALDALAPSEGRTGESLIDAFAEVRGLLSRRDRQDVPP